MKSCFKNMLHKVFIFATSSHNLAILGTNLKLKDDFFINQSNHYANILGAKTAALSCVTRPAALWMRSVQLLSAAIF